MMGMKLLLLVLAAAIAAALPVEAAAKSNNGTRWSASIIGAAPPTHDSKTYRVFNTPDSITLALTLVNDSGATHAIRLSSFRDHVRFALERDQAVPVIASWPVADEDLRIESGKSVTWTIVLTHAAGQTFTRGRYVLVVGMAAPHTVPPITLNVDIRPPANARESAIALRLQAERVRQESPEEAMMLLHLALATDPAAAENSIALGDSYVQARRYLEAIPFFERALELKPRDKASIHERLALARHRQGIASLVDEGAERRTSDDRADSEIQ